MSKFIRSPVQKCYNKVCLFPIELVVDLIVSYAAHFRAYLMTHFRHMLVIQLARMLSETTLSD